MRNDNIDFLRLIAALGIISIHAGVYPEAPIAGDIITSCFRWGVPFFFVIIGYFQIGDGVDIQINAIAKFYLLFLLYTLVYAPLFIANITGGFDQFGLQIFTRGTDGHLWFLSAVAIGLLVIYILNKLMGIYLLTAASVLLLVVYIFAAYVFTFTHKYYPIVMILRELSGVPAMLAGYWLRQAAIKSRRLPILLLVFGVALTALEVSVIEFFGKRALDAQFLFGTTFVAAGLVQAALSFDTWAPRVLSEIGRRESLGIYVFHRMAVFLITFVTLGSLRDGGAMPGVATWVGASALTLFTLLAIRKKSPNLASWLDGEVLLQKLR